MTDITVPVPADRTAEFYQFFGLWLAGSLNLPGSMAEGMEGVTETSVAPKGTSKPSRKGWGNTEEDLKDAIILWKKYSPRARAMFSLLIDNPGKEYTGDQIAESVNIPNGSHGVAGALAWPGRHGMAIGRHLPTSWREDPETFQSWYWIPAERAELFKAARAEVEGAG